MSGFNEERCDIKVWSKECEHSDYTSLGDKYLCNACEKIADLDHEVRHDAAIYVSGDYDNLS